MQKKAHETVHRVNNGLLLMRFVSRLFKRSKIKNKNYFPFLFIYLLFSLNKKKAINAKLLQLWAKLYK